MLVSEARAYYKLGHGEWCSATHNYQSLIAVAACNNLPVKRLLRAAEEAKMER